jgi:hypothetical protein
VFEAALQVKEQATAAMHAKKRKTHEYAQSGIVEISAVICIASKVNICT